MGSAIVAVPRFHMSFTKALKYELWILLTVCRPNVVAFKSDKVTNAASESGVQYPTLKSGGTRTHHTPKITPTRRRDAEDNEEIHLQITRSSADADKHARRV